MSGPEPTGPGSGERANYHIILRRDPLVSDPAGPRRGRLLRPATAALIVLCGGAGLFVARAAVAGYANFSLSSGQTRIFARDRGDAVMDRAQPDYDPRPRHFGTLTVDISGQTGVTYDSNVYATDTGEQDDVIGTVAGAVAVNSDWQRHAFSAFADGSYNRYLSLGRQSRALFDVGGQGRYDIADGVNLQLGGDISRQIQSRLTDRSDTITLYPVTFNRYHGFAGAVYGPNRLRLALWGDWAGTRYGANSPQTIGGTAVNYTDRDSYSVNGRADYAVSPSVSIGARGRAEWNRYATSAAILRRDSDSYEVEGLVNFEMGALARGELSAGYLHSNFKSPLFRDVSAPSFHGKVEYFMTPLLTLTASAGREVNDTPVVGAAGVLVTRGDLRADYELLRNLRLSATGGIASERYRDLDLRYTRYSAGLGADYRMNPHWGLRAGYDFYARTSKGGASGRDYRDHRLQASISYHY